MKQKSICEWCGRIGHKADAWIVRENKFLLPRLRININKLNALHDEEPNDTQRESNIKHPADNLEYRISPPKTSHVVSDIIERLNYHAIDNGDFEVLPSEFQVGYKYKSVPDPETTPIKSFDDD